MTYFAHKHRQSGFIPEIDYPRGGYLVGTTRGGLFILNKDFQVSDGFYNDKLLKASSVLSVSYDKLGNIWAGLDAGIACIDNSSHEYYHNDNDLGQIQSVLGNNSDIIVGTNKGLFRFDRANGNFITVPKSQGTVWKVISINNTTYVLHDQGVFSLNSNKLHNIHKGGTMNIVQLYNDKQYYVVGEYNGLSLIAKW